jgi:hypothetical protein
MYSKQLSKAISCQLSKPLSYFSVDDVLFEYPVILLESGNSLLLQSGDSLLLGGM